MLAENTLLKTACHFLLLLVGFDTLSYQKDYDRSPVLVGHQDRGSIIVLLISKSVEPNEELKVEQNVHDNSQV